MFPDEVRADGMDGPPGGVGTRRDGPSSKTRGKENEGQQEGL